MKAKTRNVKTLDVVLAACNRLRKKHGWLPAKELKRGWRAEPLSCPIARTIGRGCEVQYSVHSDGTLLIRVGGELLRVRGVLKRFALDFDNGKYPELAYEGPRRRRRN